MFGNTCKCPECKTHNNEERETCRVCGTKLNSSEINNKKEKPKKKVEKLAILLVLLIFVAFVAWVVNLGMNSSIDGSEVKSISASEAAKLSDAATEKSLKNDLVNIYEFNVKNIEISGDCAYIAIYNAGTWTYDDKKIVVTTLAQIAQRKRDSSSGTTVFLCDEHGIELASARGNPSKSVRQIRVY